MHGVRVRTERPMTRRYRALDKYDVMHAIAHRGAWLPLCAEVDSPETQVAVSQLSFPPEEVVTCTLCVVKETAIDMPEEA